MRNSKTITIVRWRNKDTYQYNNCLHTISQISLSLSLTQVSSHYHTSVHISVFFLYIFFSLHPRQIISALTTIISLNIIILISHGHIPPPFHVSSVGWAPPLPPLRHTSPHTTYLIHLPTSLSYLVPALLTMLLTTLTISNQRVNDHVFFFSSFLFALARFVPLMVISRVLSLMATEPSPYSWSQCLKSPCLSRDVFYCSIFVISPSISRLPGHLLSIW